MPLETLNSCPVCQSSHFKNYLNVEDYTVSHKEFTIQQCDACSFLFTNPRPSADDIGAYYQSDAYISHHDDAKDVMSRVYNLVRDHTIQGKVQLLNSLQNKPGNILDIGCGTGSFITACQQAGWTIEATEPDTEAQQIAAKKTGKTIHASIDTPLLQDKKFDVITMWHVLEHVHSLNEVIAWLGNHLTENGKIIIAVPNAASYDAQVYKRYWAAYDVPRHLYHFTKSTMSNLLGRHQLHIEKVLPMWFDSFYVGMLSTKYRGGGISLLNSFKNGLISNIKGYSSKSDGTNTSSLIYIISKK